MPKIDNRFPRSKSSIISIDELNRLIIHQYRCSWNRSRKSIADFWRRWIKSIDLNSSMSETANRFPRLICRSSTLMIKSNRFNSSMPMIDKSIASIDSSIIDIDDFKPIRFNHRWRWSTTGHGDRFIDHRNRWSLIDRRNRVAIIDRSTDQLDHFWLPINIHILADDQNDRADRSSIWWKSMIITSNHPTPEKSPQ